MAKEAPLAEFTVSGLNPGLAELATWMTHVYLNGARQFDCLAFWLTPWCAMVEFEGGVRRSRHIVLRRDPESTKDRAAQAAYTICTAWQHGARPDNSASLLDCGIDAVAVDGHEVDRPCALRVATDGVQVYCLRWRQVERFGREPSLMADHAVAEGSAVGVMSAGPKYQSLLVQSGGPCRWLGVLRPTHLPDPLLSLLSSRNREAR